MFLFRSLLSIYQHVALYLALICFAMTGVAYTLLSAVLFPLLPRTTSVRLGRRGIGLLFRGYLAILRISGILKVDLSALDALRGDEGTIVAPNHPSLLDAVFIISRLPDIACIMKAEIRDSVILGGGARLARYIRNDSTGTMIREAAAALRSGQQLLVFPEGTRTRYAPVNAFKGGFAVIAYQAAAPLQTVFIETNSPFLSKGWPILKKPDMPLIYRVRLGKRFDPPEDSREFIAELEAYYQHELRAGTSPKASTRSTTSATKRSVATS